jgi:alanine dehydrogenase
MKTGCYLRRVLSLVNAGHKVMMEHLAGFSSGITDADYISYGGNNVENTIDFYNAADLIV